MKNFKRILALVMVFCTVAAWMIPGVSANEASEELIVKFADVYATAGVAKNAYMQNSASLLNAAYATNKWTVYCDENGAMIVPNYLYVGGRNRADKYLELRTVSKYGNLSVLPSKFVAPGTGDYEFSISYGTGSQGDPDGIELGAYILEMPETAYTKYNIPGPTSDSILIKASKENPYPDGNNAGSVTADGTVALEGGKEYMLVFYGVRAEDATAETYVSFSQFSLTKPVVEETTEATTEATTEPTTEATTVPAETEPEIQHKTDNLTADFFADLTAAGQTGSGSVKSWYDSHKAAFDAGSISWLAYGANKYNLVNKNNTATAANGAQFSFNSAKTKAWLELTAVEAGLGFATLKFVAPGTGDYKLSITYSKRSSSSTNPTDGGAYILEMPTEGYYTADTLPGVKDGMAKVNLGENMGKAGTYTSEGTVSLVTGKEYIIVFYSENAAAGNMMYYNGFALTYQAPAATIGSATYASLGAALEAAVAGDTIKLGQDAFEYAVDLAEGVTLDLNGKTLNTGAITGAVIDSADGEGAIAGTENAPVINTAKNNVVLCDTTGEAPVYRIFSYTFQTAKNVVTGADSAATGVNKTINFYDYETALGTKDNKFRLVAVDMAEKFAAGELDWRVELGSQNYQFRIPGDVAGNNASGSNGFSSGTKSIAYRSAGWFAIRVKAPGEGVMSVSLKTDESNANTFDVYIVKASEIQEALGENYEAYAQAMANNLYNGGDNAIYAAYIAAVEAAFADEDVVISVDETGVDKSFSGSYEFAADQEYVVICKVISGTNMRLENISFNRAERDERIAQTVWSQIAFANTNAYAVVATGESGLATGYDAAWNVNAKKAFAFDDNTVASWAKAELENPEKDYGFYVRFAGFEVLGETGTLVVAPSVSSVYGGGMTAEAVSYTYTAE